MHGSIQAQVVQAGFANNLSSNLFLFFKKAKATNEPLTVRVVALICNAEGLKGKFRIMKSSLSFTLATEESFSQSSHQQQPASGEGGVMETAFISN